LFVKEGPTETAIGVFASRDRAEAAVKELWARGVPEESMVFLTRSENEAKTIAGEFGAYVGGLVGGAVGMSSGVVAASLLLPGVGAVFAVGLGAAALLGLAGAGAGSSIGSSGAHDTGAPKPTAPEKSSEDVAFFREVLKEGRSLVVVRTESETLAASACEVLDRLGLGMQNRTLTKMQVTTRVAGDVAVLDISGRITVGEGNVMLRELVRDLAAKGHKKFVLNLGEVQFVDSSGLGELVKTHASVKSQGGKLALVNLNKRVSDLLRMTRLSAVFEIEKDEASAIYSMKGGV
jgi:anti-sigma B factor antagonist